MGKILLSVANSTSKCFAQNLGSKEIIIDVAVFREVMIRGHGFKFFQTCINCLDASTLLVVYEILCHLLFSISVVIGQFFSKWPDPGCRTVLHLEMFPYL